jgi:hypothetical protein
MGNTKAEILELIHTELSNQVPDFEWQLVNPPSSQVIIAGGRPIDYMEVLIKAYKGEKPETVTLVDALRGMSATGLRLPRWMMVGCRQMIKIPTTQEEARTLIAKLVSEHGQSDT